MRTLRFATAVAMGHAGHADPAAPRPVLVAPKRTAREGDARALSSTAPVTAPSLTALILRAKDGDANAFAGVVNAYYSRCLRFAQNMLGNSQDAEEVVQDTFIRVHRALVRFDVAQRFEPWLFRILANRCRTVRARERRHAQLITYGDAPEHSGASPSSEDGSLWRDEIRRALAMLPAEQREAFLLRHVEGLGYEDIAAATGDGVSALKMRVKRACDFLRARLQEVERA
jgi:RNA polymerase sigma-70 factor (ECF subfamily)